MNLDELLDDAKLKAPDEAVFELVKEFEGFAVNIAKLSTRQDNEADMQALIEEMKRSHEKLQGCFARVAASYGMTIGQFVEYLENPANFKPEDWSQMQAVKDKIADTLKISEVAQKTHKINKNVKI